MPGDGGIHRQERVWDSADNPACSDRALNKGYVHASALNAGRLDGTGSLAPKASTTSADADAVRPTPTWRMTWRDHRGVPTGHL